MLNRKQLVCVWIGIVVFALLALFPPWYEHLPGFRGDRPLWHAPLFSRPEPSPSFSGSVRVDGVRLMLEWSVVVAITAGLLLTVRTRQPKG